MEGVGLAGLPLNCPQCGRPMRYLHAKTLEGQTLPASAPPSESSIYVYACPQHGSVRLGVTTPFQRDR